MPDGLRWQPLTLAAVLLCAALGTTSCLSTSGERSNSASSSAVAASNWRESGTWEKVRESPETYFPAGVDRGQSTDFFSGEWVMGGVNDPIFYVPKGGNVDKTQSQLLAEARRIVGPYQKMPEPSSGPLAFLGGGDSPPKKKDSKEDFDIAILQDGQMIGGRAPESEDDERSGTESSAESDAPSGNPGPNASSATPSESTSTSSPAASSNAAPKLNTDDFWLHRSFP